MIFNLVIHKQKVDIYLERSWLAFGRAMKYLKNIAEINVTSR